MKHNYIQTLPFVILFSFFLIAFSTQIFAQRDAAVEFDYVKGEFTKTGEVNIAWGMVSNKSVMFYQVLRSVDGVIFEKVGSVKSDKVKGLDFLDNNPVKGTAHYIINAVDKYEKITQSRVLCLEPDPAGMAGPKVRVYPNPVVHDLNIEIGPYEDVAKVTIKNVMGLTLGSRLTITGLGEKVNMKFNISSLPNGIYFVIFDMGPTSRVRSYSRCVTKQ